MLTPDQIEALRDRAGQIMDPIVEHLLQDIAQRVSEAGQFTSTTSYEAWRLQNLGLSQRDIRKEIQRRLKVSKEKAEELLTQAAEVGYRFDMDRFPTIEAIPFEENASLQQIVSAIVQQADEDLTNVTQTLGFVGSDGRVRELTEAYQQACDFAFEKVVTGAQDYNSAIRDALRGLSKEGIRTIDYASGRHRSVEAAVRANIMGGLNLMEKQISQKNHDDLGCDGWEVSAHAACAPDHEPIQGKQYSDAEYKAINDSLDRGIGEYNCGHSAFPIILGVNSPQYTPEELEQFRQDNEKGVWIDGQHYTTYEATQRQRRFEREIRFQKHRVLISKASGDTEQLQTDETRLVRLRQEYNRFCKAADLRPDYARQEAAGFTWKEGMAAEKTAKVADAKAVKDYSNFDITEGGKYKVLPYSTTADYEKYIRPEYYAQRMTHADNSVLWAADGGYIQNSQGYTDINGFMRDPDHELENPKCQKTIDVLLRRTDNCPFRQDYVGYRKTNIDFLKNVMGVDIGETSSKWLQTSLGGRRLTDAPKDAIAAKGIVSQLNALVGTDAARVIDKGFMSISMCENINYFTHYPVQFAIQMPKSAKGLITDNWKESEFIAKPGSALEILGAEAYNDGAKDCIRIFAKLIQN